jgi:hypothetical protein
MIPVEKRGGISEKLLNYVLKSKKESKLPSSKTIEFLEQECQLAEVAKALKEVTN